MKTKKLAKITSASSGKILPTSAPQWHAVKQVLLDLDNITVELNGQTILQDISFCVHKGECIGLIGPNGAGKTTLLKVLLKLLKPTAGRVKYSAVGSIGYIQQRGLQGANQVPISVMEVVKLGTVGSKSQATMALEEVGLASLAGRRFDELSGGQKQRVLIARALAGKPQLLVLDEPTTGIDETSEKEFYRLVNDLTAQGITIILVSHDIDAVLANVTRVICLNQTIVYDGPPEHFEPDTYVHAFAAKHRLLHHQHGGHN